jgi:hypothetical protein
MNGLQEHNRTMDELVRWRKARVSKMAQIIHPYVRNCLENVPLISHPHGRQLSIVFIS